jgi:hypothetical protein
MDAWTNPGDPTSVDTTNGSNWVNITFTHGQNGEYTMVRRNASGSAAYPTSKTNGDLVANTTNTYVNDTGRVAGVTYYYALWTWDSNGNKWCDYQQNITGTTEAPAGNTPPTQSNQRIWNVSTAEQWNLNATGVTRAPTSFNVTISDLDGNKMNITIKTNESSSWTVVNQTSGTGLSDGTYSFTNTSWVDSFDTKYWISFNVTDGTDWTNQTFNFTTESESTTIEVTPNIWDLGNAWIEGVNATTGYYFNLTNNGNTALAITVNASNATNSTTGFKWNLTDTPGLNNFSILYNKSGVEVWKNINLTFDTFVENLALGGYQTFDLKIFMATLSDEQDLTMHIQLTLKSVAA